MVQRNAATDTRLGALFRTGIEHLHSVTSRCPCKRTLSATGKGIGEDGCNSLSSQQLLLSRMIDAVSLAAMRSAKKLAGGRNLQAGCPNLHANFNLDRFVARILERPVSWPAGQILAGLNRRLLVSLALVALCGGGCRSDSSSRSTAAGSHGAVPRGGELLVSVRSEPRSFNRHA